ncbi:PREDICTED: protein Spindly-like isoform X2 [Dinoponera quadriceps]|uniref:Protein Spindly-like isoform X2 n=1 Tax=Dinoponera quadriceps TaxID=609295 RepID=A0A6P3XMT6_DINQU|nr:PREDICTED: protein Spindly-like isoform X2 [Dinoponera quadriceps]
MSEMCDENMTDKKNEECLEESSIVQDDYKKLKQENECYRQELYVLRLRLKASEALEKELQEANEALEQSLEQCTMKAEKVLVEREEKYRAERIEYESHIVNLETKVLQSAQEIIELREELRKHEELKNERSQNLTFNEDNLIEYKEKIEELVTLLQNEGEKQEQMEEKLANMKNYIQELQDTLQVIKEQLAEKNIALENTREELAANRMELESLKITPANDACKGNSLFAEVEDRRQMLLDKMNILQDKYNEAKRALNKKANEIKSLKVEKAAMIRKWETDAIDTLQENADLLEKYKSRIFELENKLKAEMKKNSQVEEVRFDDDSFDYTESLLAAKRKELEELHKKLEKQSIEILTREEANYDISKQLRYWRSKAMSMEAQFLAVKTQIETEQTNDNNNESLLEVIKDCTITDNADFEKTCNLYIVPDMPESTCREKAADVSEKPTADGCATGQKEAGKVLRFAQDAKDTGSKPLKRQSKQYDYPIISIPEF